MGIGSQPDRDSCHDYHSDHNAENPKNSLHTLIMPCPTPPVCIWEWESDLLLADPQQAHTRLL
ncbi:hypothetical protein KB1_21650 [Cutibacterium modestum]|uniref:Uncharacterized protein n=1 Tax=Cutibacterium modestum TaxID=2559073 RepID=A0AAD1KS14_9ACTN|nr:hypothetical protein KB1_21650 [Cutibacterium modestum]